MHFRNNIFFALALMVSMNVSAQSVRTESHIVQAGETLYSIARRYEVNVDDILKVNPGLQADRIMAGQTVVIPTKGAAAASVPQSAVETGSGNVSSQSVTPLMSVPSARVQKQHDGLPQYKTKHEVKKKETVYSISRMYGVSEQELLDANPVLKKKKLKKGSVINIPYSAAELQQRDAERREAESKARMELERMHGAVKVAVILPFDASAKTQSAESRKMTNLYQGFLLAVDSLKQRGVSIDVYAYDEASSYSSVDRVLAKPEMKGMHLIIGPVRHWNMKSVAEFAQANGAVHVVPLSNDSGLTDNRSSTFQVNISTSYLYEQVYNKFFAEHKEDNIILVDCNTGNDNVDFISGLKQSLNQRSIAYKTASLSRPDELHSLMADNKKNVIVPTSGSAAAVAALCGKLDAMHLGKTHRVQLFGYPEWQAFTGNNERMLQKYNAQFFTTFFSNDESSRNQRFNSTFRKWFKQDQYKSIPRYGELGFDIGAYFIKGIREFRNDFKNNIHNFSYSSMEFPFNFEKKDSKSGYQNKSILFITKNSSGTITVR